METKNVYQGLAKFQSAVAGVKRDATNPHFHNRYASLDNVVATIRPHMDAAGLCFMQLPGEINENGVAIETRIIHAQSGEYVSSCLVVPIAKRDAQGVGSAITYGCRYSLMAMLGIPPTDDDGEASIQRGNGQAPRTAKPAPAAKAPTAKAEPKKSTDSPAVARLKKQFTTAKMSPNVAFGRLRQEGMLPIDEVKIANQAQLDAFLARHDEETIDGWASVLDEILAMDKREAS